MLSYMQYIFGLNYEWLFIRKFCILSSIYMKDMIVVNDIKID